MKKHLFKFALTLLVCMLSNAALADENYLVNEDFSTFPSGSSASYNNEYNGWKLNFCRIVSNELYVALKIEDNSGYARTPTLDNEYEGDVHLSFKYAKTNKEITTSITMNILNGGTFKDNNDTSLEILNIDHHSAGFTTGDYDILGVNSNTRIEFRGQKFDIDDVKIIKLGEITLNDQINSSEAIAANNETICTVKTVRKLNADKWNTLCLPFNVNKSLLEATFDTNVELRVFDEYDDATYTMKFKTPENNSIAAGTPFLMKVNEDIVNPTFTGVTIKKVAAKTIESNGVSFVGTYSPVELNTDGTHIFITTDNKIAKPLEGKNEMKGLRAYITVPSGFDFNDARLFLDDEATFINSIGTPKATNNATLYNLQGQRVKHPRSGLYIKNNKLTIIR